MHIKGLERWFSVCALSCAQLTSRPWTVHINYFKTPVRQRRSMSSLSLRLHRLSILESLDHPPAVEEEEEEATGCRGTQIGCMGQGAEAGAVEPLR
jgi:hypothetical protein